MRSTFGGRRPKSALRLSESIAIE